MMWFYLSLSSLLLIAVIILRPLKKNCFLIILIIILSFMIYFTFGQFKAYQQWQHSGKSHYQLLIDYQELGGLDGIIQRITQKLQENPDDRRGWEILGKMYLLEHNEPAAEKAFKRAKALPSAS